MHLIRKSPLTTSLMLLSLITGWAVGWMSFGVPSVQAGLYWFHDVRSKEITLCFAGNAVDVRPDRVREIVGHLLQFEYVANIRFLTLDDVRIYDVVKDQAGIEEIMRIDLSWAWNPTPTHGAVDVARNQVLSWTHGDGATMSTVYFGQDDPLGPTVPHLPMHRERPFFEGDCRSLVVPGSEGYLGVLTGHAPLITALEPGEVRIVEASNYDEAKNPSAPSLSPVGYCDLAWDEMSICFADWQKNW